MINHPDRQATPAIFHITHYKAGSQWIYKILRELAPERIIEPQVLVKHFLNAPLNNGAIYPTVYVTKEQFYSVQLPEVHRKFIVIRDLRDTLVSAYFSLRYSHVMQDEGMVLLRDQLKSMSIESGLLLLMDQWLPWCAEIQLSWRQSGERVIKYEHLLNQDCEILEEVLIKDCDIDVTPERLREVILGSRFENVAGGRKRGDENLLAHERKGIAGDWENYFTPRVINEFNSRFGDVLHQTGYQ